MKFSRDTIFGIQVPLYVDACLKEIFPTLKYGATASSFPRSSLCSPQAGGVFEPASDQHDLLGCSGSDTHFRAGGFEKVVPQYLAPLPRAARFSP